MCDVLQTGVHQLEKVCGQVSVVDEGTILLQEGVKMGSGQLSKTLSHDRKEELCHSCDRLRKQFWGLEFWLVKYRDECGAAYMRTHSTCTWTLFNQNKEMKRKISDSKTSCADETGHLRAPSHSSQYP